MSGRHRMSDIVEMPARLSGAAMGYVDDDENWHEFDGVEVTFMLPRELVEQGISVGHEGRLTFTIAPPPPGAQS